MKAKATTTTIVEEFEITLPLYRRHDVGGQDEVVHYERIEQRGKTLRRVRVTLQHDYFSERTLSLTVHDDYVFDEHSSPDFNFGLGKHSLLPEEWEQAVASLELVLADVARSV